MVAKDRQNSPVSVKAEVGEIDTRAPFQSVKDAVSLFGECAFSGEKPAVRMPKPQSAERVLAKETQLHLARKELTKQNNQLKNAETTKSQVLVELEKAKKTTEDLMLKLNAVNESKELAVKQTEAAKLLAKPLAVANSNGSAGTSDFLKIGPENARGQYAALITELDIAKQELTKIKRDCYATTDTKVDAFWQVKEAELSAKENMERVGELSKDISDIQKTIGEVKLVTLQSQKEQANIFTEKDVQRQACKAALEESTAQLLSLKKEFDPEVTRDLEARLAETGKQMESMKASHVKSAMTITLELDGAKGSLMKVAEEESSLRSLAESLKVELDNVQKEHTVLKEKEVDTEAIIGNLHVKLRKSKSELETCLAEETKAKGVSDEMIATLHRLVSETENARREAEEMKNKAEGLKCDAEATKNTLQEAQRKLRVAFEEVEEAKTDEGNALYEIKNLSEKTTAARASTSDYGAKITISKDEFDSLSRKVNESDMLAEMKVAAALAQVEAVKESEKEALRNLEATLKEIEEMKLETMATLKRAEMAEAARRAVEGELRKWRDREQKKAAETASRILADTDISSVSSPQLYKVQKHQHQPEKASKQRVEKERKSASKKVFRTNLSGVFNRKKNGDIRPFEDGGDLERFSWKTDCSIFPFGSHSKKRPDNLIIGRMYDHHIYDLVEVAVENYKSTDSFAYDKKFAPKLGSKPVIVFSGEEFENVEELKHLKEVLIDMLRGEVVENLNLAGVDRAYVCTAVSSNRVFLTHCALRLKKSGNVVPRIELVEVGPSMDLVVRRNRLPNEGLKKEAMKSRLEKPKKKEKNVIQDIAQGKLGKIYIPDQKLGEMNLYDKSKGVKRERRESKMNKDDAKPQVKKLKEDSD